MLTPTREAILKALDLILAQMIEAKTSTLDIQKLKEIINNLRKEGN